MAVAKEQIRQIISENNINSVADMNILVRQVLPQLSVIIVIYHVP